MSMKLTARPIKTRERCSFSSHILTMGRTIDGVASLGFLMNTFCTFVTLPEGTFLIEPFSFLPMVGVMYFPNLSGLRPMP